MADFVAVLKKTLDGMGETTPATRARVYDKARSTIAAKLAALNPPPPAAVAERQTRVLEDAIASVEAGYATKPVIDDPLAELESVFSSIDRNKNQPNHFRQEARPEPKPEFKPAPRVEPRQPAPPAPAARDALPDFSTPNYGPEEPVEQEQTGRQFEPFAEEPANEPDLFQSNRPGEKKRIGTGLIAAALAVVVLGAGGYGLWSSRSAFTSTSETTEPAAADTDKPAAEAAAAPAAGDTQATQPAADGEPGKFTQRLTPEGTEVDPGPAGGTSGVGEGTSVAALTQAPTAAPATAPAVAPTETPTTPPAAPAGEKAALAVGQKAIFYEERTNVAQGSAEAGTVVWTLVQESPGGDLPPEPAIRAEATIPGKDMQLRMTIRRNADQTLPASHIVEMIFLTPDGFEGGGIENILRVAMKSSEQDAGNALLGIPAKIADGFFLVALNDSKAEVDANLALMRRQSWIDVPVVYKSGRRALFTLEKGIPGDKVFNEALKAWQAKAAG